MTSANNTPGDFSADRYQSFAEIFAYNHKYHFNTKIFADIEGRALTYGQIYDLTARLCRYFQDQGLKQGDRAVILSHDDLAVTTLFMGCLRYGLTAVILSPDAGDEEKTTLIAAAKPAALFMDEDFLHSPLYPSAGGGKETVCLPITPGASHKKPGLFGKKGNADSFPQKLHSIDPLDEITPVPPEIVAYILFTSGTTSQPKGVEITHGNLLAQMKTFVRHYGYTDRSELLNCLPLHHTDGLTQGPVVAFTAGASVYRPLRFAVNKVQDLIDSIYKHRITHFIAVPSMLQLIDAAGSEADNSFKTEHFKFIISTAGYLDPHLWERFENRFGVMIVNVYGLTETVCEALYCGPSADTRKIGTIGKPVDTECRIVDDSGNEVPVGESGELWVKGPHIMKGYFDMPEETAEVLSDDGWFKTGDLCKRDEDGFYTIVGRKKNIIIVGGINIYPDDVANVLRALPGVLDAAVWGEDDPVWGEMVVAAITAKDGTTLDTDKLGEEFMERASINMMPRHIHVVEELPRGPAGKVIIRDLQAMVAGATQEAADSNSDDLTTHIIAVAAQSFKCPAESLSLESTAETTKGWNSLAHVEFLLNVEKEFGIKIEPRDILSVRSIGDALKIVEDKKKAA